MKKREAGARWRKNSPASACGFGTTGAVSLRIRAVLYQRFRYDGLKAEKAGGRLKVSLQVENTGRAAGDEVAQLYLRRISPSATGHPVRRLIGFERLHHLAPGEKRTACFTVNPRDLEIYLESEGKKIIEPGRYQIYAGGSCLDEQVCAGIDL